MDHSGRRVTCTRLPKESRDWTELLTLTVNGLDRGELTLWALKGLSL